MPKTDQIAFDALKKKTKLHFIGVGGVSMSTLALIALRHGHTVSGYDRTRSPITEALSRQGIAVRYDSRPEAITGDMGVVYTAAIPESDPELAAARALGIPCVPRAAYLGGVMLEYPVRVGVSGTHGKSTTTTMLATVFDAAGVDPTVACGAVMPRFGATHRIGGMDSRHFLYEACEYTDSFLSFHPTTAVILNVELDHVDYFHSMEQLYDSFRRSAAEAELLVICADDPGAVIAAEGFAGRLVTAGLREGDYTADNLRTEGFSQHFTLLRRGEPLTEVTLPLPGIHNLRNALCAAAAAIENGIAPEDVAAGFAALQGAKRRFERMGEVKGAILLDDYAHHPGEITATLRAARAVLPEGGRLLVVFQPHTYSRTAGLMDDFAAALSLADRVVLAPIFAAREKNTYGVSSKTLAEKINGAVALAGFPEIADWMEANARQGDIVITMGAGTIRDAAELLLKKYEKK